MVSVTSSSLIIIGLSYALSAFFFHIVPLPYLTRDSFGILVLSLLPPSILTYCLLFRLRRVSSTDFENRVWHSERLRGLAGGSDRDGDGVLRNEEKSRESAEWANSLLRGIWPIVNPEMYVFIQLYIFIQLLILYFSGFAQWLTWLRISCRHRFPILWFVPVLYTRIPFSPYDSKQSGSPTWV